MSLRNTLLLFVLIASLASWAQARSPSSDAERAALVQFANFCGAKNLQDWGLGRDACKWSGVTCNDDGNVVGLSLSGLGLTCRSVAALRPLSALKTLDLSHNSLSLPFDPSMFPQSLEELDVSYNGVTGSLSMLAARLPSLRVFVASNTLLSSVPFYVPVPPSLVTCDLSATPLECQVPDWVVSLCGGLCGLTNTTGGEEPITFGSGDASVDTNYGPIFSGNVDGDSQDVDNDNNNNDDNNNNNDNNNDQPVSVVGSGNTVDVVDEVINVNLDLNVNPNWNRNRNYWNAADDSAPDPLEPIPSIWTPEAVATLVVNVLNALPVKPSSTSVRINGVEAMSTGDARKRGYNPKKVVSNGQGPVGQAPQPESEGPNAPQPGGEDGPGQHGAPPQETSTMGSGDNSLRSNFGPIFQDNAGTRQADDNDNNNNGDNNNNNDNNNDMTVSVQGDANAVTYHARVVNYNLDLNLNHNDNQNINHGT